MRIRAAERRDLPEILSIYNDVIRRTTAVYTEQELSADAGESWFGAKVDRGFPFIVACDQSAVVGFASYGEFRAWPCYRSSVEHSVHVRADRRGRGIGRALVSQLIERACAEQRHVMIAAIDADNAPSIGLHASMGFEKVGHFREVGCKFGRWLDVVFLQRML